MTICILGNSLTALTLAKALTKQNIYVDILYEKKILNINKNRTIGISKSNATVEIQSLEACVRENLNKTANRRMAVLKPLCQSKTVPPVSKVSAFTLCKPICEPSPF